MLGVYIHIPYCRQACHYCDFHFSTNYQSTGSMHQAMIREIDQGSTDWDENIIRSIYFGGGTPSSIPPAHIKEYIERLSRHFDFDPAIEISLEANPEDIHPASLIAWSECGVNRLSLGIQSLSEIDLRAMNRIHSAEQARAALDYIAQSPIDALSVDIIYGLNTGSTAELHRTTDTLLGYSPHHISAYALTVEQRTALAHQIRRGQVAAPEDQRVIHEYRWLTERLGDAGYEHYEVSNYALPGHRSVHNSSYWTGRPYWGIGPAAHSYSQTHRWKNIAHNHKYIKALQLDQEYRTVEELSVLDRFNEWILIRLRTTEGISDESIKSWPEAYQQYLDQTLSAFIQNGRITRGETNYYLSSEQMLWADGISAELMCLDPLPSVDK